MCEIACLNRPELWLLASLLPVTIPTSCTSYDRTSARQQWALSITTRRTQSSRDGVFTVFPWSLSLQFFLDCV